VVVIDIEKRGDRDNAVTARVVLDDHRLTPWRLQLIGENSRTDVGARARSKWHDEFDRPLPPCCRPRSDGYSGGKRAG